MDEARRAPSANIEARDVFGSAFAATISGLTEAQQTLFATTFRRMLRQCHGTGIMSLAIGENATADTHVTTPYIPPDAAETMQQIRAAFSTFYAEPWRLPPVHNQLVTRDQELEKIAAAFEEAKHVCITQQAILGPGGHGKTKLAIVYGNQRLSDYHFVIYLKGSASLLESDLRQLAGEIGFAFPVKAPIETIAHSVYWLLKHLPRVLFIIDDVDNPSPIKDLLPPTHSRFHCLYTSRRQDVWARHFKSGFKAMPLGVFKPEESDAFFVKGAHKDLLPQARDWSELANTLGHLPLAESQALSYINAHFEDGVTVASYHEAFQEKFSIYASCAPEDTYQYTLLTTWLITLPNLLQRSWLAVEILAALAYLDGNAIPFDLILKYGEARAAGAAGLRAPDYLRVQVKMLESYSLITREANGDIQIHQLLQQTLRWWLSENQPDEFEVASTSGTMSDERAHSSQLTVIRDSLTAAAGRGCLLEPFEIIRRFSLAISKYIDFLFAQEAATLRLPGHPAHPHLRVLVCHLTEQALFQNSLQEAAQMIEQQLGHITRGIYLRFLHCIKKTAERYAKEGNEHIGRFSKGLAQKVEERGSHVQEALYAELFPEFELLALYFAALETRTIYGNISQLARHLPVINALTTISMAPFADFLRRVVYLALAKRASVEALGTDIAKALSNWCGAIAQLPMCTDTTRCTLQTLQSMIDLNQAWGDAQCQPIIDSATVPDRQLNCDLTLRVNILRMEDEERFEEGSDRFARSKPGEQDFELYVTWLGKFYGHTHDEARVFATWKSIRPVYVAVRLASNCRERYGMLAFLQQLYRLRIAPQQAAVLLASASRKWLALARDVMDISRCDDEEIPKHQSMNTPEKIIGLWRRASEGHISYFLENDVDNLQRASEFCAREGFYDLVCHYGRPIIPRTQSHLLRQQLHSWMAFSSFIRGDLDSYRQLYVADIAQTEHALFRAFFMAHGGHTEQVRHWCQQARQQDCFTLIFHRWCPPHNLPWISSYLQCSTEENFPLLIFDSYQLAALLEFHCALQDGAYHFAEARDSFCWHILTPAQEGRQTRLNEIYRPEHQIRHYEHFIAHVLASTECQDRFEGTAPDSRHHYDPMFVEEPEELGEATATVSMDM